MAPEDVQSISCFARGNFPVMGSRTGLAEAKYFLAISCGRHAIQLFEKATEVIFVCESKLIGNFFDQSAGADQQLDGFLIQAAVEIGLGT